MSKTLTQVLAPHGITAADAALAEIEVPVLAGLQRQGDVMIHPVYTAPPGTPIPPSGVAVVRGESGGNTHLLHAEGPCTWAPADQRDGQLLLGHLTVADGAVAYLIHTDEHGANGIAPGVYALHGKREQADVIRRVAD
jgi:hypothetical protein